MQKLEKERNDLLASIKEKFTGKVKKVGAKIDKLKWRMGRHYWNDDRVSRLSQPIMDKMSGPLATLGYKKYSDYTRAKRAGNRSRSNSVSFCDSQFQDSDGGDSVFSHE